jgi:hypothetical protein
MVYFQIGESQFFPGQGWTDLAAACVGAWVEGLVRVAEGISKQERFHFSTGRMLSIFRRQKKRS